MLITNDLKDQEFLAKVLPDLDNKRQGRYKVHIPDLMPSIDEGRGIWVKNQVHNWRITNSDKGEYGQYFPLQPGTKVIVKFFENDPNTGYVDRIISDHVEKSNVEAQDCTKEFDDPKDRDEQYVLFKTPKKWNIFYVNEDTEKEPNTIYLIYNRDDQSLNEVGAAETSEDGLPIGRRTVFRIDESGLTFWTRDNNRVRIKMDDNKEVDGNQTEYIKGYRTKHIDGEDDLHVHNNQRTNIDLNQDEWVKGNRTETIDIDVNTHIKQNNITTIDLNEDRHVGGNSIENIDGNEDRKVGGNCVVNIDGNGDVKVGGNLTIQVMGNTTISTTGNTEFHNTGITNLHCAAPVAIDAPMINLNSGIATSPTAVPASTASTATDSLDADEAKPKTHVRDLGPDETTEYGFSDQDVEGRPKITGDTCDEVTTKFNIDSRETLPE